MSATVILTLLALIVAILGYYESRRSNDIQLRQAVALEESNRITTGREPSTKMATPPSALTRLGPTRWPVFVLLILLLMNAGVTGFDYYMHRQHIIGNWDKDAGDRLIEETGDLSHRSLPIDGYRFSNCNLDGSSLYYEGYLPTEVTNCTGTFTVVSHNHAIQQTMLIMQGMCTQMAKMASGTQLVCKPQDELTPLH